MLGTPNHGTQVVGTQLQKVARWSKCLPQMGVNSDFLKVLNYQKDIQNYSDRDKKWDLSHKDILHQNVSYHLIGGVIPDYTKNKKIAPSFDDLELKNDLKNLEDMLYANENTQDLVGYDDGMVPANSARLYNFDAYQKQNSNLNHMYIHADHSQLIKKDEVFPIIQKLLKEPIETIPTNFETVPGIKWWKPYGKNHHEHWAYRIFTGAIYSPAVLSMQAENDYVGFSLSEGIMNTTESAYVDHLNGSIQWFDPPSDFVSYRIEGFEDASYGVRFTSVEVNDDKNEAFIFENHGLPTNIGQVDQIEINWETQEAKIAIDYDGDGEFDEFFIAPTTPGPLLGTLNHNRVNLQWSGSEPGNRKIRGYRIYRASVKDEQFKAIGFVNASENDEITSFSNNNSSYQFTDNNGTIGESYLYFVNAEDEGGLNSVSSNIFQAGPLTLPPTPHLRISAELNKPTFSKGEEALIFVTVFNQGNATATNTRVKMTLPQELSFLRASRYRSVVQTPSLIEFELGAIAPNSIQTFQVDVKVLVAVSQLRSIPIHFDVNCTEKSSDFAHVMLQLVPQRSGRPDLYLGLYYRNAQWDPLTASVYIPQDTPLEIDFVLTGAQAPYELNIDWGDSTTEVLSQQKDLRQTLRHQFKNKGKKTITVKVTDQLQRSKTATISMEVR
jgi:uncharacterized repeat protein (TIGR01451 family)